MKVIKVVIALEFELCVLFVIIFLNIDNTLGKKKTDTKRDKHFRISKIYNIPLLHHVDNPVIW